ncbi:MAG: DUF1517 domain-containing protein [Prochlorotrichaceae cyanobacterium]|jgi:uncharacterized membrane protein
MKPLIFSGLKMRFWKRFVQATLAIVLTFVLVFGLVPPADAARSGGRIGGGSFRSAPSRTYRAPSSRSYSPRPLSPYGGGFNPLFFIPFFGGGGFSGLFGLMVLLTIGGFIVRTLQSVVGGNEDGSLPMLSRPATISVAKIRVGLSAEAKALQQDLNRLATTANTNSNDGLVKILQETTLALLRNPEYWCYGNAESVQTKLQDGETQFNRMVLMERSKVGRETIANVKGQVQQATVSVTPKTIEEELTIVDTRSYIVVTLIVGIEGKLSIANINNEADLKQAIQIFGSISQDQLLALEILWTPPLGDEVLTADELVAQYPDLKLI